MKFHEVLEAIWDRGQYRRACWRKNRYICAQRPAHAADALPYLEIVTDEGRAPYVPAQCDMRADDWEPQQSGAGNE